MTHVMQRPFDTVDLSQTALGRDVGIDVARGIAILMVVFGHALDGAQSAGFETEATRFLMRLVYAVHVPLLFLLSGLLVHGKEVRPLNSFVSNAVARIVWPYLLWSFVLLTMHYGMGSYTNTTLDAYRPISILWNPPAVMWFLQVLLVCNLLLRMLRWMPGRALLCLGLVLFILPYVADLVPPKLRFVGLFLIGASLGRSSLDEICKPGPIVFFMAMGVVTAAAAWAYAPHSIQGYPAFDIVFLPAAIAGPALILAFSRWHARSGGPGLLSVIGQHSMAIFVTHILATAGTRIVLLAMGANHWWLIIGLATLAGVLVPLGAALYCERRKLSRYLGW